MKRKRKLGRKLLSFVLTLAMVFSTMTGIVPGMSITAQAEPAETLLTTITPTGTTTYSESVDGVVNVTLSGISSYHDYMGWSSGGTVTVTPVEGYTITKCRFDARKGYVDDTEAPFSIDVGGAYYVKKVEVYGYQTSSKTAQTVTQPNPAYELTYTGEEQALLTGGASVSEGNGNTDATIQYSLTPTDDNSWVTGWADIKATNAGTYKVYYRVAGNDTYADFVSSDEQAVSVTIAKADPETPTGMTGKYGQRLSTVSLLDGWSWDDGNTIMNEGVGDYTYKANYNPTDATNYNSLNEVDLTVNVGKGDGTISFGQTVVESTIGGEAPSVYFGSTGDGVVTFTSENENVATVNDNGYLNIKGVGETTITASVVDSDTYHYATKSVSYKLIVKKRSASIKTVPTASEITYGQTLADSTLSGGEVYENIEGNFSWADSGIAPAVSDSETTEYAVKFTPKNSDIFAESTCKVKVKVKKAPAPATKESLLPEQKPAAKNADDLVYTGEPIELVTAPTTDLPTDYEAYYSTDDGGTWSKDIPKKKGPGSNTVKVKYVSKSGNYEDIQLDDISVTITVDKSILGNVIQEATEYKKEITDKTTDSAYTSFKTQLESAATDLGSAISAAEEANNSTGITDEDVVSAIDALTTALNKAKADVEKIENHKAFDEYKKSQKTAAGNKAQTGDSEAANNLITTAQNTIETLVYDDVKSLDENRAAVDAIINKLEEDLTDQRAVDAVIKKIDALPQANQVTVNDRAAIEEAITAYNTLTDNQKGKVGESTLNKLTSAETAWVNAYKNAQKNAAGVLVSNEDSAAANTLVTNAQNDIDKITYDRSSGLDAYKNAVDAIITKLKADVADQKAADAVITQINALRVANEVTIDDKNAIEAARAAYNALTDGQKDKVTPETLKKLTDAEDRLKILQVMSEVSAKTGSGMTYTGNPIQLINTPTTALPAGYTMKYAVTTENVKPTDEKLYTTTIPTKTEAGT